MNPRKENRAMNKSNTPISIIWQLCLILSLALATPHLQAQGTDSSLVRELDSVTISALRLKSRASRTPMAITVIDQATIQRGNQQLSMNESLDPVPGLFALNQENFAQDLRISIRGFGARAAFGIRGVKILVDGIPESTPDGQAQVDNVDMGVIDRMEVIRGPASGLYGNASGGVILLQTEAPPEKFMAEGRMTYGAYNFQRYQIKTGFRAGAFSGLVYGTRTTNEGYRSHSEMQNTLLNGRFHYTPDSASSLTLLLNYVDSPLANDPGGVDSTAAADQPRSARALNETYLAGESVRQGRIALAYEHKLGRSGGLQTRAYYLQRDFENALPFASGGAVGINRQYAGGGISYTHTGTLARLPWRLRAGLDLDYQADDRTRRDNNQGVIGELGFDQLESFRSIGAYLVQELYFTSRFHANLGLRYDALLLKAEDRFLTDGDDSGSLRFNQLNPVIGLLYAAGSQISLYTNVATSFETPTLSELSANPDGGGGFNPELQSQKALNYEIGIKGYLNRRFQYSAALFYINVFDELVPYELQAFPDREFFRNAGKSNRMGAELSAQGRLAKGLQASASYTYGRFTYADYESNGDRFDGNRLPGIPDQMVYAGLSYTHRSGFFARIWARHTGTMYANDANSTQTEGYTLVQVRAAWAITLPWGIIEPFVGVNNLLNEAYPGNLRINAFGGRYYEPGAAIHAFGGLRVRIEKQR